METVENIADKLLKAIDQIIPSVASDEKYTAAQVCLVALYHAEAAIFQRSDHLRARQCLFALTPFRTLAKRVSKGTEVDLLNAGYTCAVALKRNKIDEANYISEMIKRLGGLLSEKDRASSDEWVDSNSTDLPAFSPENEKEGWEMVQFMLDGEGYRVAFLSLHERRSARQRLTREVEQFVQQRNDQSKFSAKVLPNFGSLVVGPNSASAHYGLGGGSVTVVGGKLSVIFPRSGNR
jgi:hypothetical protein